MDYRTLGQTPNLADMTAYSDFEEGVLTVQKAGDNWVRQGGYSDQEKDTCASLDQTKNEIIVTCHPRSLAA